VELVTFTFCGDNENIRRHHIHSLVMQLLTCNIISIWYSMDNKKFTVNVDVDGNGLPKYRDLSNFRGMNVIN